MNEASIRFVLEDRGDMSVGIWPWFEIVTVTRSNSNEFTEDEIEELKKGLRDALCPDGGCVTEKEYEAACEAENKMWDEAGAAHPLKGSQSK